MKTKALIVVMSHLSDAQMEISMGLNESAQNHINFAKFICTRVIDLNSVIDPDDMYHAYLNSQVK